MKALELLYEYQQADEIAGGYMSKPLEEAIEELENLQNRKCENCKFGKERYWDWDSGRFPFEKSFECNKLDKSGQLTPYSVYEEHKFYCSPNFYCNNHELKGSK